MSTTLTFRAPGRPLRASQLLDRAWHLGSRRQIRIALAAGAVRVEGVELRDPRALVPAGALVEAVIQEGLKSLPATRPDILAQGDGWTAVDKPAGWSSHGGSGRAGGRELLAEALGRELAEVLPVHRLDRDVTGIWLVAHDADTAAHLGRAFEQRRVVKSYDALVPHLPWRRGRLTQRIDGKKAATELETAGLRNGLSHLRLAPVTGRRHQLRRHLAEAGAPILGDVLYGGILVGGGIRLRATGIDIADLGIAIQAPLPPGFWPDEPIFCAAAEATLIVSRATVRALDQGHPWVLRDSETSDPGRFPPGEIVRLATAAGPTRYWGRIEGPGKLSAHRWSRRPSPAPTRQRVKDALARREPLFGSEPRTDAFRLIHGQADGLPGLFVDRFGEILRVLVRGRVSDGFRDDAVALLRSALTERLGVSPPVIEILHLRPEPAGRLLRASCLAGEVAPGPLWVHERGLAFRVTLGLEDPWRSRPGTGLYLDQRANRERLARAASDGGRWLNLFAHTGAFTVALLAAGADHVTSVDLSRPYLDTLEENLLGNEIDSSKNTTHQGDVRRFLDRIEKRVRFDGIIVDPPTAAAVGRRFWSIRREGGALVAACLNHLAPGGRLLVCRNDHRARGGLVDLVRQVAGDVGARLDELEPATPGLDFPSLPGFAEGDPFEGVLARRARDG